MSIPDYYRYAILAVAAYVRVGAEELDGATFATLAGSNQQGRLPVSLGTALFNPASSSSSRWRVLHYYGGDAPGIEDTTGFAATLFESNGEKVLGIRGTEPTEDGAWDLLAADIGQIGILGLALAQVVSMVNLIQRMKGRDGDPVVQIGINTSVLPSPGAIAVAGVPPMFLTFSTYQAVGQGLIGPGEKIKVTGHSLGGHLAYIAARLFPDDIHQQVHVFDAAGYDPSATNLAALFSSLAPVLTGGVFLAIKAYLNAQFGAAATGVLPLANQLTEPVLSRLAALLGTSQGSPEVVPLQTEDILPGDDFGVVSSRVTAAERYGAPILVPSEANSHAMEVFMDSLALRATLHSLNATLTLSQSERLLQSSSFKLATSDERLAAALFKLLLPEEALPGGAPELPISDATGFISGNLLAGKGALQARQAFYQTLLRIQTEIEGKGYQLVPLVDYDATSLSAQAFADMGYRYAIAELNSFAIVDPDGSLYARFQLGGSNAGELDLYDANSGRGHLTSTWLDDRARLVQAELLRNVQDNAEIALLPGNGVTATEFRFYREGREEFFFADPTSNPTSVSRSGRRRPTQRAMVGFADDEGRTLFGTDNVVGDHLYGGAGDDAISGERGEDQLEGGLGDDRIRGGEGADVLLGGAGADVLDGGLGADTYQWRKGDGFDAITDVREGGAKLGTIEFLGEPLAGLKQQHSPDNPYLFTDDRGVLYALIGSSGVDGTLTIVKPGEVGGLVILGFRSGDFGIELGPVQSVAMTDRTGTSGSDNGFSTQPGHGESLQSEADNQRIYGLAGNDRIIVSHQGAEAYGGIGRDFLTNDGGDQKLYGEEDDDVLIASAGNDLLDGGSGNDALQGGADDDVLIGGDGNDFIDGGLGSDAINAGDGHDFIVGGGTMVVVMDEGALDQPTPPQFGVLLVGDKVGFGGMTGLLLASGDGANVIDAGAGNDVVIGGEATDYVEGGLGDDVLLGFAGFDSVFGDDGNDYILGDVAEGAYTLNGQVLFALAEAHGSDYLDGGAGEDTLSGDGGGDELIGGAGNDLLLGDDGRLAVQWHGADYLDGGEGDDQLIGHGGDDVLFGGTGQDQLDGDSSDTSFAHHGADYLDGEDGNDILKGSGGADTLFGGDGQDQLFGDTDDTPLANQGDDFLDGGAGEDYLRGYAGNDFLFGGEGADEMLGEAGDDYLEGEDGDDLLSGGDGADQLIGGAGADDLQADAGDDTLDGGEDADLVFGGAGNDVADGGAGNDQLAGNEGNDTLRGGEGDDIALGDAGADDIDGGAGADTLLGGGAGDTLFGGEGDDLLAGEDATLADAGDDDRLDGGGGADTLLGEGGADTLVGGAGADFVAGGAGNDALEGGEDDDQLFGDAGDDLVAGGDGADIVQGGIGHDTLEGNAGDDLLYGGVGNDVLAGGAGNDAYLVDDAANGVDRIVDSTANGDINTLILPFAYGTGVVRLSLGSLVVKVGPGIEVHIQGFDPDDPWADVAINRFEFTNRTLTYEELLAENPIFITGTPDEDALTGTVLDDVIDGREAADFILGREGDDQIIGGEGEDTLAGGAGNDTYRDVDAGDVVLENAGEGIDKIETQLRVYTMPDHVEDLVVLGVGGTADLTGNDLANTITVNSAIDGGIVVRGMGGNDVIVGSAGNDTLDGGEGNNQLAGRAGDDLYLLTGVDQTFILEFAGEGHDTILAYASVSMPLDSEVEDVFLVEGSGALSVVGNGLRNHIVGNELGNILYGELPGNAVDGTVPSSPLPPGTVYQVLGPGNDVEGDFVEGRGGDDFLDGGGHSDTLLGGDGNDELVGQVGADLLAGGAGNDTLDGSRVLTVLPGMGIVAVSDDESTDTMEGGEGDDTYFFGDADDVLVEAADEGTDTVITTFDHALADNFENLVLTGTEARIGQGNAADNVLRDDTQLDPFSGAVSTLLGAAGTDTLVGAGYMDGGEGADVMIARAGISTTFIVDDEGDQTIKSILDGQFAYVESSVTFALAENIDNLTLTGTLAIDGLGNERSNVIIGNDAANRLIDLHDSAETELFYDLLYGMEGDDLIVTRAGRHFLDGGAGNDTLDAGAGNDHLDGGEGADIMYGGKGDDLFHVDDVADVTNEAADEGYDKVFSSVSHVLGNDLEALYLTGEAELRGEGNDLDNLIVGNWGANVLLGMKGNDRILADDGDDLVRGGDGDDFLDGGGGADTLEGGLGSDTYVLSIRDDVVIEVADGGIDTVIAFDDVELSEHVENLAFVGDFRVSGPDIVGLDGIGNDLANAITGNDGDNNLAGRGGDDEIDGRAGSDEIDGDEGGDRLYGGDDALRFTERDDEEGGGDGGGNGGIEEQALPDKTPRDGNEAYLAWNADTLRGGDGDDSLDGGSGNDQLYGGADDDLLYGGDDGLTADEVFQSEDEEGGSVGGFDEYDGRVFLKNDDYLEGGEGNDVLDGGSGDDELRGGEGDDYLFGGADGPLNTDNDDFLDGGEGRDTLAGGTGDDVYVLQDGTYVETTDIPVYSDCGTLIPGAVTRVWSHDTVIERANEGYDTIIVAGDYTLPEHVEQLLFEDHADARIGRGNSGDNALSGNSFDNRLEGLGGRDHLDGNGGNDVLHGGAGDDVLRGGSGNDVFLFGRGGGRDLVEQHDAGDAVHLIDGLTLDDITLSTNGSDITIGLNGSRDRIVLGGWLDSADRVESVVFCDGTALDAAAIVELASGLVLQAADDAAEVSEGGVVNGNLLANDVSSNLAAVLTIADPGIYGGEYGTLVIAEDGSFSYAAGPQVAWLSEGESISERFEYAAQDDANANDRAELEITIVGRNDAPVIFGSSSGALTEDGLVTVEGEDLLFNGAFEDEEELRGWIVDGDTDYVGNTRASLDGNAAYFGAVGAQTFLGQEIGTTEGATYLLSFWLKGGADAGAMFSASWNGVELVSLADETLTEYTEFRFLVQGAADASSLSFALRNDPDFWYLDEVSVREIEIVPPQTQQASGTLAFGDADGNDAHHVLFEPQSSGYLGYFEAAMEWDGGWDEPGAVLWSFAVENDALQFLRAGETLVQSYDVSILDAFGASATSTVSIVLTGANDGPTANDDAVTIVEGMAQEAMGNVLANDTDPDHGTILRVVDAGVMVGSYGTLTLNGDGTYRYVLDAGAASHLPDGEVVTDTFTYTVTDDAGADAQQSTATLEVRVEGQNSAPTTAPDSAVVAEDGMLEAAGNVLANDLDAEGSTLAVLSTGVFHGQYGTLTLDADGTYRYTLDNERATVQALAGGQSVVEVFSYEASDGTTATSGTVHVTVIGANDAPGALPDGTDVAEDVALQAHGNVLDNDSDVDESDRLAAIVPGTYIGTFGTLVLQADGSYAYVLDNASAAVQSLRAGDLATETFTYAADDGTTQTASVLVITIAGENDAPNVVADAASAVEDATAAIQGNVLANDSDPDRGTVLTVTDAGVYSGAYGTLTLAADGSYSYVLNNAALEVQRLRGGQTVHDEFTYRASDGQAEANGIVAVTITGVNDAPVISSPIADRTASMGVAFSFTVPADTFADVDAGDTLTYSARTAEGSPLPAWLSFNPATRTFSGVPTQSGSLHVRITATDSAGAAAAEDFVLTIAGAAEETGELIVGTDGNDVLTGTAADDVMDGREGLDKMSGGKGDDIYFVDEWCGDVDKVIERANEGRDTVFALTDYTLAAHVEDVQLIGCEDIDATGNAQANVLSGNEGDNALSGRAGSDAYVYQVGGGKDVIDDKGNAGELDVLKLQGISAANVRLKRSNDDLIIDFPGKEGRVTLKKWFSSSTSRVERIQFDDGSVWDEAKIRSRVGVPVSGQHHGGGSSGHGHEGHHGNDRHDGHHRHDDDNRRRDRDDDGRRTDGVDEALDRKLKQPVRFDFEEVTQALGNGANGGRTMTAAEIAQRWAEVQRYTACLSDCRDDEAHDADIAQLRNLFGVPAPQHGDCFGFEGSTGGSHGPGKWFKALEGLCEGFRRL